jgi:hypothetical protein
MRFWIDPSRGYISPLVQKFSPENGKILQEYSARNYFLHERSGLWFPQEYEEKTWDAQTGALMTSRQYRINPATFQLNQPVSDYEFSIDVPEDRVVVDERVTPNAVYMATESNALSLAEGGLDLSEMSWLERLDHGGFQPPQGGMVSFWIRGLSVGIGVLMISIAIYLMWRNRYAKDV